MVRWLKRGISRAKSTANFASVQVTWPVGPRSTPRPPSHARATQCYVNATYRWPPLISDSIVLRARSLTVETWLDQWFDQ